jgi:hypothetical protein
VSKSGSVVSVTSLAPLAWRQKILQRFHLRGHARARPGAAREDDVGDPDVIRQIGERRDFSVLIREREIGDLAEHRQSAWVSAFRFCQ